MAAVSDDLSETTLRQACSDLDHRLRSGERCRVEHIFADRPLLAIREEAALQLIYTEFVTREDIGQRPTPEEYLARFPTWQTRLKRQFHVHRLFRDNLTSDGGSRPADNRAEEVPKRLGSFELLSEVARGGGGGVVYRARQTGLNRIVALKVLRPEVGRKARARSRFFREAKVLAALRHPHIVAVHDLGEQGGWIWYSMDFAEGGSLNRLSLPLTKKRAVVLMRSVALTVQHVHDLGVVHGDLKPSNVLLDGDGHPMLGDFGLARTGDDTSEDGLQGFLGTPAYMAPEQFDPEGEICSATDVWALGTILFELLTGRRPFIASSIEDLQQAISEEEPPCLVESDALAWICGRCLAKDAAVRFTAAELAEGLKDILM